MMHKSIAKNCIDMTCITIKPIGIMPIYVLNPRKHPKLLTYLDTKYEAEAGIISFINSINLAYMMRIHYTKDFENTQIKNYKFTFNRSVLM
jgi:hypothetical protein